MAATKAPKKAAAPSAEAAPWVGLFNEHVSSQMTGFAGGMRAQIERLEKHMERRFESVERQLGLLTDAVCTRSKALQAIEAKLEKHDARLDKLEGAAE